MPWKLGLETADMDVLPTVPSPEAGDDERFIEVEFVVEPGYAGWRLDRYLCAKLRKVSRARVQRIIERDVVSDVRLKASSTVRPGQRFRIRRKAADEPETPERFEVLHLDDDILVVDKPAGLPVHPSSRYQNGTLVGRLRERFGPGFAEPAHRLDRETSGVLVLARHQDAMRALSREFYCGRVRKTYLAICEGWPSDDELTVDAPIAEGGAIVRIAVRIDPTAGRPSQTRFVVQRRFERDGARFALLRCHPLTGRQHQIRVHLRHAGLPLVGDKIYGHDEGFYDRFTKHCLEPEAWEKLRLPRQALHAAELHFTHPRTREPLGVSAPLPHDLVQFLGSAI